MTEQQTDLLDLSVRDFIAAAAAKQPTPGGGSVAGVVGALGVALGEMALNFTRGKKKYAEHEEYYAQLGARMEKSRTMFLRLVGEDVQAYQLWQATNRMEDGPEKAEAMATATAAAINVPREVAKFALALLEDLKAFSPKSNPWLISDLTASAALAVATVRLCDYNVRINIPNVADTGQAAELKQASADDLAKAVKLFEEIEEGAKPHLP